MDVFDIAGPDGYLIVAFLNSLAGHNQAKDSRMLNKRLSKPSCGGKPKKPRSQGSRLKEDYIFLKCLENKLDPPKPVVVKDKDDEDQDEPEVSSNENLVQLVKDGVAFLDSRAEFWTNMK